MNHRLNLLTLSVHPNIYRLFLILISGLFVQSSPLWGQDSDESEDDDEDVLLLSPFEVTTNQDTGYRTTNSTAGTSLNMAIRDIPVPLEVINREMLDDMQATDLNEALELSAGVFTDNYVNNSANTNAGFVEISPSAVGNFNDPFQNNISIRGYTVPNQQRAGFRVGGIVNAYRVVLGGDTDGIMTERIEVVRGPQSLLYGINVLSGIVNIEPKRPLPSFAASASVMVGSNNEMRTTLDVTGPLIKDKLNYRLLGAYQSFEDPLIDFQESERKTLGIQFEWQITEKTKLFVEYVNSRRENRGIGPLTFSTSAGGDSGFNLLDEYDEAFNFGRDRLLPTYVPRSTDANGNRTYDLYDTYYQDHDLSFLGAGYYAADGIEDGPLVKKPGNEAFYDFSDRGPGFNISGPDTYKIQEENNLLAQLYHNFTENLSMELGVYHTEVDIEELNVALGTQWNTNTDLDTTAMIPGKPYSGLEARNYQNWYQNPEVIAANGSTDPLGFGVGEAFLFPLSWIVPVEVPAWDDPSVTKGFGSFRERAFDVPFTPEEALVNNRRIDRLYAFYRWYKRPSSSVSNQLRGRLVYEFETDFWGIDASHSLIGGYSFIEDKVDFFTGIGNFASVYSAPRTKFRTSGTYGGKVASDPVYFRRSVFDTDPIRLRDDDVIADARNYSLGNLGLPNQYQEAGVARSGYKEATIWYRGMYGIYRGQLWNDKLTLIGGVRRDSYQGKEKEQLVVVDYNYESDKWLGVNGVIPDLTGLYGNEDWVDDPSLPDSVNQKASKHIRDMRYEIDPGTDEIVTDSLGNPVYSKPNGTIRHTYDEAQNFVTKTAGFSWRVIDPISMYFVYSEGVFPNTGHRDGADNPVQAERTRSTEIGVKFDLFDSKVSGTLSLWQIKRENAVTQWRYAPSPAKWHGGAREPADNIVWAFSPENTDPDKTYNFGLSAIANGNLDPNNPDDVAKATPYRGGVLWPLNYGISTRFVERAMEKLNHNVGDSNPTNPYSVYVPGDESFFQTSEIDPNGAILTAFDRGPNGGTTSYSVDSPGLYYWLVVDYEKLKQQPEDSVLRTAFDLAMQGAEVHGPPTEDSPTVNLFSGPLQDYGDAGINYMTFSDEYLNNASTMHYASDITNVTFEEDGWGFDGQITYSPTPQWDIIFTYAHQEREVAGRGLNLLDPIGPDGTNWGTEYDIWVYLLGAENFDDPTRPSTYNGASVRGLDLSFVPQDSATVRTRYSFDSGILDGLTIGGGVRYEGEVVTSTEIGGDRLRSNLYRAPNRPAVYFVSGFVSYKFEWADVDWKVQLNVDNILDHDHDVVYKSYNDDSPFDIPIVRRTEVYYDPRVWRLALSARF